MKGCYPYNVMGVRLVVLTVAVFAEGLVAQAGTSKSAPVQVEGGVVQGVVEHGLAVYWRSLLERRWKKRVVCPVPERRACRRNVYGKV